VSQMYAVLSKANIISPRPKTTTLLSSPADDFMASLRSRVKEVTDQESKLPLVVLNCMLPRQVLTIRVKNQLLMELVRNRLERETPFFGVLGMARLASGEYVHLPTGVEVEIFIIPTSGEDGVLLELTARRRFVVEGEVENAGNWTEAQVRLLDTKEKAEKESKGGSRESIGRAIVKAREFKSRDMRMEGSLSLVDRWIQLARENEKEAGQIDRLLLLQKNHQNARFGLVL